MRFLLLINAQVRICACLPLLSPIDVGTPVQRQQQFLLPAANNLGSGIFLRQLLPMWKWMNNYFFKKIQKFSSEKKLPDMATFWNVLFQKRQTLLEGKDMKTADIFRRSIIHGQRRGSNVRLYRSGRHKKAAFNCSSPHIWHVTDQTIDTPLPATCLSA